MERFMCQENHTAPTKLSLHVFWSRHPTSAPQAKTNALRSSGREGRRAVRHLSAPIPPASLLPRFAQHHHSPPSQRSMAPPRSRAANLTDREVFQDHTGNLNGGLGLGIESEWGNGRHKAPPQLTAHPAGHRCRFPVHGGSVPELNWKSFKRK